MLKECFVPKLKRLGKESSTVFQPDGAPPRFSLDVRQYFNKVFPNQWIAKSGLTR